jgi:hypothetical protein
MFHFCSHAFDQDSDWQDCRLPDLCRALAPDVGSQRNRNEELSKVSDSVWHTSCAGYDDPLD